MKNAVIQRTLATALSGLALCLGVVPVPATGQTLVSSRVVVPASARPIMPPGLPPMPGSATPAGAADKPDAAERVPVPAALQERLNGLRVTVIMDGACCAVWSRHRWPRVRDRPVRPC
jgi:hypothetical protein